MSIKAGSVCVLAMLSLSACATQSQLRHGFEVEGQARLAADSAQRAELAAQQAQLTAQQAELASLRTDLTALRTEFGAKIAEVAEGLRFAMPVHFAYDDASVRQVDVPALERFANVARKYYPGAKVTVEGFADPAGTSTYNLALSRRRADAVRGFITSRGIDGSLVNTVGYGETRLVTRAARDMPGAELNRRVVFVIETPPENATRTMALLGQ
jgi:outer membrane protein OmpA-like peptidoglycan-associated protein